MNKILAIPIASVIALTSEAAVSLLRAILRAECGYSKVNLGALTISSRLTIADGGIDAEINVPPGLPVPPDCFFQSGLTGFQIKSGTTFRPWTAAAIRGEMLDSKGQLYPEMERLIRRGGRYTVVCTGC